MDVLSDLHLEQFDDNGWFFGKSKTVPGVLLCAPTAKEIALEFPKALKMVLAAREQDELAAKGWKTRSRKSFSAQELAVA